MASGFLSGVIWGGALSVVVVGSASLLSQLPGVSAPEAGTVEVPAGSQFDISRDDIAARLPTDDGAVSTGDGQTQTGASRAAAPIVDTIAGLSGAVMEPAAVPETAIPDAQMSAPRPNGAPVVEVTKETPVAPTSQNAGSILPSAPIVDTELSISTDPSQPIAPDLPAVEEAAPFGETRKIASLEENPVPVENADVENADAENADKETAADMDTRTTADPVLQDTQDTQERVEDPTIEAQIEAAAEPVDAPVEAPVEDPVAIVLAQSGSDLKRQTPLSPAPEVQSGDPVQPTNGLQSATAPKPMIVASAAKPTSKPFGNLASNVPTNRLPSLAGAARSTETQSETQSETRSTVAASATKSATETTTETTTDSGADGEALENLAPIERFSVAFDNAEKKPLMAIVLLDDGSSKIGLDALAAFPYPISFAIDASWDGAQDAMISYRAAGFEVLAMVDMIKGATAADAETAMAVYLDKIPESVAVMEGIKTGFQGNRQATDQVTEILLESGHGWVLFPKGLNTVQKLASKAGVPTATVFRDFDSKGQKASAIRRFLDHAAFKAGQQEAGVIMVGRLRADTISALLLWGLQDRASSVALAPVSAVLTHK